MAIVKRSLALTLVIGIGAASAAVAQNPYLMTPQQNFFNGLQSAAGRAQNPWLYSNPYAPNPALTGGLGAGYGNPYAQSAYDPYYNPYMSGMGGGSVLYGQAELLKGYGTAIISQEQSRIMREQAMQAKIDTARKRFDFDLYVKANTPTFADEQKRIAKNILKRIHVGSSPIEIANGKALNILLDDVRNFPLKKVTNTEIITLSDDVLKQLNVTTKNVGVGLLRHGGKFTWPVAVQEHVPLNQLQTVENQVKIAVKNAAAGNVDGQILADIGQRMVEIKNVLNKKVDDIPTGQYLAADRFLSDFRDARQALEEGQMAVQDEFTRFIQGGKTVQEVADFMVSKGLRFAPSAAADQAGYRALHSALVAFDIALNTGTPSSEYEKGANQ
jgi:hypothetical protein